MPEATVSKASAYAQLSQQGSVEIRSPDGRRLLLWPEFDSPAILWDINEGTAIRLEDTHRTTSRRALQPARFSPDGSQLAMVNGSDAIGPSHGLLVWDTASGAVVAHDATVRGSDIQFSQDGQRLLLYHAGGVRRNPGTKDRVVLWSKEEGAKTLCKEDPEYRAQPG